MSDLPVPPRKRKSGEQEDETNGQASAPHSPTVRKSAVSDEGERNRVVTRRRAREAQNASNIPPPAIPEDSNRRSKNQRRFPNPPGKVGGEGRAEAQSGPAWRTASPDDVRLDAIVKVFCIHTQPNFSLPWQRKRQYASSGSGFAVEGHRILTNAHCVDHHTQVKVKRRGSDVKYVAQVVAVGAECDIAMLKVDEEGFWEGIEPVKFGTLPELQDAVTVIGYPIGGDTMSVSSGVVSRIEVTPYAHGASDLLGVQIDAAINAGNSGGPAFNSGGECVGIAFQSLKQDDVENVGYIIPTPVIEHFVKDYEANGEYTGFPCLGIEWQKMENPHLREGLGMKPHQKGVLVKRIEPTMPVASIINESDILLKFDGIDIANDGTVPFRSGERINFTYLISRKYIGDEVELEVLKNGKPHKVPVKLKAPNQLIPVHIKNQPPSYFIIAGLVFTPITVPYLRSEYGKEYDYEAPVKIIDKMLHTMSKKMGEQVVVLSQVLASDINIGYEDIFNTQVVSLNGQGIEDLKQLVELVDNCKDEYLRFNLDYNQKVVLKTKAAKKSTKGILDLHCIPQDRSSNMLPGKKRKVK